MNKVPSYFFKDEQGYQDWLSRNRDTGFVASGFINKDGSKVWQNKLTIHKLPCDSSLNHQSYEGRRTNYGKLCHNDEDILIRDCRQRVKGIYNLGYCRFCMKKNSGSLPCY